ncbi:unnamed protein product [Urochloa decumbens]|uniref:4Fe-4S ferredoxin-type domain-containing protein n=1 Tax=Urochloa decumbens TaxID=240449 RepID=A0ABC8WDF8_9POAL
MAFSASALKGATVAAICMVLVLSLMSKPAEGSSCPIQSCISKCPSKCNKKVANSCQGAGELEANKCHSGCLMLCKDNCPAGATCDCESECDRNCRFFGKPILDSCRSAVFNHCKDSCEKDCKAKKVNS